MVTGKVDRFRTPLKRAKGLGSAGSGSEHWLAQRLTAIFLVPLTFWFVWAVLSLLTATDPMEAVKILVSPLHASALALMLGVMLYHGMLGMTVIIEDYVHCRAHRLFWLLLLRGVTWFAGVAACVSVVVAHIHMAGVM
jgi:succinate dehydrogenase / fumarate reductase membrane anchor subunit